MWKHVSNGIVSDSEHSAGTGVLSEAGNYPAVNQPENKRAICDRFRRAEKISDFPLKRLSWPYSNTIQVTWVQQNANCLASFSCRHASALQKLKNLRHSLLSLVEMSDLTKATVKAADSIFVFILVQDAIIVTLVYLDRVKRRSRQSKVTMLGTSTARMIQDSVTGARSLKESKSDVLGEGKTSVQVLRDFLAETTFWETISPSILIFRICSALLLLGGRK